MKTKLLILLGCLGILSGCTNYGDYGSGCCSVPAPCQTCTSTYTSCSTCGY